MAMTARESSIVDRILRNSRKVPGLLLRKRHGSAITTSGDPDLYGSYRGQHVEYEVKRPGQKPTELQHHRMAEWRETGAVVGWGCSWEDMAEFLGIPAEYR